MKKTVILICLLLAICLCACTKGTESAVSAVDLDAAYAKMTALEDLPQMFVIAPDKAEYIYGLMQADCAKQIVAVCENSMLADEIWLIEAADSAAADRIEALAKERLDQKAAEAKDYSPEQYQIIQQGQVLRRGSYVAMIVSAKSAEMAKFFS